LLCSRPSLWPGCSRREAVHGSQGRLCGTVQAASLGDGAGADAGAATGAGASADAGMITPVSQTGGVGGAGGYLARPGGPVTAWRQYAGA